MVKVETLDGVEFFIDKVKKAKLVNDTLHIVNLYNLPITFYRSITEKYADGLGGALKPDDFDRLAKHLKLGGIR